MPDRIYLRLEARDEAGNIGIYDTTEPVSLDRHRPEGRIRGVRAIESGDPGRGADCDPADTNAGSLRWVRARHGGRPDRRAAALHAAARACRGVVTIS